MISKKKIALSIFSLTAIACITLSVMAAAIVMMVLWQDNTDTMTIARGDNATFKIKMLSEEGANVVVNAYLYSSNYTLIKTLKSYSGADYMSDNGILITPADYNGLGGTYHIVVRATDGIDTESQAITLIITQEAPLVLDIPDFTIEEGTSYIIDLNDYVLDADDLVSSMIWTITGNTNILVSIDGSNIATITAPLGWTGSETLTFTATDPSGDSSSDTSAVTVVPVGTINDDDDEHTVINVKDLSVESFGDGMLMVRNKGSTMDDVRIEVDIEASDAPSNNFRFDITSGTVRYFDLNLEGLSGDYLAKVKMSSEDSSASGYMILSA